MQSELRREVAVHNYQRIKKQLSQYEAARRAKKNPKRATNVGGAGKRKRAGKKKSAGKKKRQRNN